MTNRSLQIVSDLNELEQYENTAVRRAAEKLASITEDITATSPGASTLQIRDVLLDVDLDEFTGGAGDSLYDDYTTPSYQLTTGGTAADGENSLLQFDNDANFENKAGVVYGFQFPEPDDGTTCPLTELTITTTNSTIGTYDLTSIDMGTAQALVFDQPLIVGKEDIRFEAYAETEPSNEQFKPLAKVAEPAGETISSSGKFADGSDQPWNSA